MPKRVPLSESGNLAAQSVRIWCLERSVTQTKFAKMVSEKMREMYGLANAPSIPQALISRWLCGHARPNLAVRCAVAQICGEGAMVEDWERPVDAARLERATPRVAAAS